MGKTYSNQEILELLGDKLKSQWHPTKNLPTTLKTLTRLAKPVWWIGPCGHEWDTPISERIRGSNCVFCAKKRILLGFNDFESQNKEVSKTWHPTKNGTLNPNQIFAKSSSFKVWWLCAKGHPFAMKPLHRAYGHGCPKCASFKGIHSSESPIAGETDLATTHPNLILLQWHPTLNLPLSPDGVTAETSRLAWWYCPKRHVIRAPIRRITKTPDSCVYCTNKAILVGFNDLQSANPTLAAQWHPAKNGNLLPSQICVGNTGNKAISWLCDKGHDWTGSVSARSNSKHGCPYCAGNRIWVGYNDLATLNPILASEWHPTKNNLLTPKEYAGTSGKSVWWLGKCGHEWKAQISNRKNGAGCNTCRFIEGARKKRTPNLGKDLASVFPLLATEWHPTKNDLLPSEINPGSKKSIWWQCPKGHEWKTQVTSRAGKDKTNCPVCARHIYVSRPEQQLYDFIVSLGLPAEQSNRKVLGSKFEIDIWIPSLRIGIEFNGVHWHAERPNASNDKHYTKWLKAKESDVELIQIWEDDWTSRKDLVRTLLAYKLGRVEEFKMTATSGISLGCLSSDVQRVVKLPEVAARTLMDDHHLNGFVFGSLYLGLQDELGVISAGLVLANLPDGGLRVVRFAGVLKEELKAMLDYVIETIKPEYLLVNLDNSFNSSSFFVDYGFTLASVIDPNFMYVVKGIRVDRGVGKLDTLPPVKRIWDAGQSSYSFVVER